jgi:hypothetical protein
MMEADPPWWEVFCRSSSLSGSPGFFIKSGHALRDQTFSSHTFPA